MEENEAITKYMEQLFRVESMVVDEKRLQRGGLAAYIADIVLSPDLRLGPRTNVLTEYISQRVELAIQQSRPIQFAITPGGYKNIHVSGSPHLDWAEVFQLDHLLEYLVPIGQIYEPGVVIEYSGDALALCFIDNLKPEWVNTYNLEFEKLLNFAQRRLPKNIYLRMNNVDNYYDMAELEGKVDDLVKSTDWDDAPILSYIGEHMAQARNNLCWDGRLDWRNLSETDQFQKLKESVMRHKYWLEIDFRERSEYLLGMDQIVVIHRLGIADCYPVVSVKGSDIQYWEGTGVIEMKEDVIRPKIFSPKQWNAVRSGYHSSKVSNTICTVSPSLKSVPVLMGKPSNMQRV